MMPRCRTKMSFQGKTKLVCNTPQHVTVTGIRVTYYIVKLSFSRPWHLSWVKSVLYAFSLNRGCCLLRTHIFVLPYVMAMQCLQSIPPYPPRPAPFPAYCAC